MEKKDEIFFSELYEKTGFFTDAFINKGIPEEDLEQERALLISEYIYEKKHTCLSVEEIIEDLELSFSERINGIISQDEIQSDVSKKILKRVNKVNDAALKYKEDFFVKPTPRELADYLGVTENYILDTVQMSGYEITEIDFEPETDSNKGS